MVAFVGIASEDNSSTVLDECNRNRKTTKCSNWLINIELACDMKFQSNWYQSDGPRHSSFDSENR